MSSNVFRPLVGALLLMGSAVACEAISGLSGERTLASPDAATTAASGGVGGTGGGGGVGGAGGSGAGPCVSATYPDPPTSGLTGGTTTFIAALRKVDLGDGDNGGLLGLDLDGKCTCDDDGPSCLPPSYAKESNCDGPGGRDNALAKVFEFLAVLIGDTIGSPSLSDGANGGKWSMVFRVEGYNGQADDDEVRLSVFPSPGTEGAVTPTWTGNDAFRVASTSIAPGGTGVQDPAFVDPKAYVVGNVLVASLPQSALVLPTGASEVAVDITAGLVMAEIVPMGSSYGLRKGLIAGRWRNDDVFRTLSRFRDGSGAPICMGQLLYGTVKGKLCGYTDILSSLGSPTDECDAISAGIGFEADPAALGSVDPPPEPANGCPPEDDPINDSCAM